MEPVNRIVEVNHDRELLLSILDVAVTDVSITIIFAVKQSFRNFIEFGWILYILKI